MTTPSIPSISGSAQRVRGTLAAISAVLSLSSAACAPSVEEVRREFRAEVERSNTCRVDSDCVVMNPGCPLGCHAAVPVSQRARLEEKARELIEDYDAGGPSCQYECAEAPSVACVDNACMAE